MSNKKETPVSWLMEEITYDNGYGERFCSFIECVGLSEYFKKALQMESQKQQKYDEMLGMLDGMCNVWNEVGINDYSMSNYMNLVQQLVKEAKEL
jgi:hypothetical protein